MLVNALFGWLNGCFITEWKGVRSFIIGNIVTSGVKGKRSKFTYVISVQSAPKKHSRKESEPFIFLNGALEILLHGMDFVVSRAFYKFGKELELSLKSKSKQLLLLLYYCVYISSKQTCPVDDSVYLCLCACWCVVVEGDARFNEAVGCWRDSW